MRELTADDVAAARSIVSRMNVRHFEDALADAYEGLVVAALTFDEQRAWTLHRFLLVRRYVVEGWRRLAGRTRQPNAHSRVYVDHDDEPQTTRPKIIPVARMSPEDLIERPDDGSDYRKVLGPDGRRILDGLTEPDETDAVVDSLDLRRALRRLPARDQELALAASEEGGRSRLAEKRGVTPPAIYQQWGRLRKRLKNLLEAA